MPASPGPEASMGPAEIVKLALQMSIMLTVFGFGLRAPVQDALYLVRHPRMLVISLVAMLIVMPFIALALVLVFDPPQLARVALVALVALAGPAGPSDQAAQGRWPGRRRSRADGGRLPPVGRARSRVGGASGHRRGHYRPYGAGAGLRPHFGRTLGILRCWLSPALSGTRASPGGRGRELPVAGCRGGDHPVSAHRRRRGIPHTKRMHERAAAMPAQTPVREE